MNRRLVLVVALALAGCTTMPVFHETEAGDRQWWRTESRQQWRWYGADVWKAPVDVYFATQERCEAFRAAHPSYTKPEEVCQEVRGRLGWRPTWKR